MYFSSTSLYSYDDVRSGVRVRVSGTKCLDPLSLIKIVESKMNILSLFYHPHVLTNLDAVHFFYVPQIKYITKYGFWTTWGWFNNDRVFILISFVYVDGCVLLTLRHPQRWPFTSEMFKHLSYMYIHFTLFFSHNLLILFIDPTGWAWRAIHPSLIKSEILGSDVEVVIYPTFQFFKYFLLFFY